MSMSYMDWQSVFQGVGHPVKQEKLYFLSSLAGTLVFTEVLSPSFVIKLQLLSHIIGFIEKMSS